MSSIAEAVIQNVTAVASAKSSADDIIAETPFEYYSDTAIGLAFLGTTLVAAQRCVCNCLFSLCVSLQFFFNGVNH